MALKVLSNIPSINEITLYVCECVCVRVFVCVKESVRILCRAFIILKSFQPYSLKCWQSFAKTEKRQRHTDNVKYFNFTFEYA